MIISFQLFIIFFWGGGGGNWPLYDVPQYRIAFIYGHGTIPWAYHEPWTWQNHFNLPGRKQGDDNGKSETASFRLYHKKSYSIFCRTFIARNHAYLIWALKSCTIFVAIIIFCTRGPHNCHVIGLCICVVHIVRHVLNSTIIPIIIKRFPNTQMHTMVVGKTFETCLEPFCHLLFQQLWESWRNTDRVIIILFTQLIHWPHFAR